MEHLINALPEGFLDTYWEQRPFFASSADRASGWSDFMQRFPAVPEYYVRRYKQPIKVFSPGAPVERAQVLQGEALQLLSEGSTLYLVDYHRYDVDCAELIEAFCRRFGLEQGRASIFISSHRAYMPFHWDRLNNLTWQLSGTKRWLLAPNTQLKYPLHNHAARRAVSPEVAKHARSIAPLAPSRNSIQRVLMTEASLLYVPRGYWHATRTSGMSISLSLNFEPSCLADHLAELLRDEMRSHPSLRLNLQGRSRDEAKAWAERLIRSTSVSISELACKVREALAGKQEEAP